METDEISLTQRVTWGLGTLVAFVILGPGLGFVGLVIVAAAAVWGVWDFVKRRALSRARRGGSSVQRP
jgi:hypothetical protein